VLAEPDQIDVVTFNRDVWALESETVVQPEGTRIRIMTTEPPDPGTVALAEAALDAGHLELHGNYVWRPASGIYDPHLKDDAQKRENLQFAVLVLNDPALSPLDKAEQLLAVRGFGNNVATGLVMMFHPDRFAIQNKQSEAALDILGIPVGSLKEFQETVGQLRTELEAGDFLELDWFLYLVAQGKVRVGPENLPLGIDGGDADDQSSVAAVRAAIELMYPDLQVRRTCLGVLVDSIEIANAVSPASWGVTMRFDQRNLRLNVSWTQACVLNSAVLYLVLDREALDPDLLRRVDTEMSHGDRSGAAYPSMPFAYGAHLPIPRLADLLPLVRDAHRSFVERSARQVRTRVHFHRSHTPSVIEYLRQELRRDVPEPEYWGDAPQVRGGWLFQANPTVFNLAEEIETRKRGDEDDWTATRYRDEMRPGQAVLLWQGGSKAGIYAVGELTGEPFERPTGEFWPDRAERPDHEWAVPFRYTDILVEPIRKPDLQRHPILRNMQVLRAPQGTNFKVSPQEWAELRELIDRTGSAGIPRYWVEKTKVRGYAYREAGEFALGRAIVAPVASTSGADVFRWVRDVRPGDLVLHLTDGEAFTGISRVAEPAEEIATRPEFGVGTDRTNIVRLRDFHRLEPPLPRGTLFNPPFRDRLIALAQSGVRYLFYGTTPELHLRGGAYVTPVPPELLNILNDAYGAVAGTDLLPEPDGRHDEERGPVVVPPLTPPTIEDLAAATNLDSTVIREIEALLLEKKQLVFEGPPGSGKTFVAKLFARYFTGNPLDVDRSPDERVELLQFHQSYGYEDFVQGIRPVTDEEGRLQYHVLPGTFMRLCELAARNPEQRFVLIIDEINRGNLSRIFGELLLLLEYRNERVRLPYGAVTGSTEPAYLSIPENLYLIGTMNSTDRSLALIDYALRRRFYFYQFLPVVDGRAPVLEAWLAKQGMVDTDRERVLQLFIALNHRVQHELSPDFQVGHSYFMTGDIGTEAGRERVWRYALRPLLAEYFHNLRDAAEVLAGFEPSRLLPVDEVLALAPEQV
jgi:MoxR-like ATPase